MNTILKVVGLAPDDEGNGEREDIQEANKDFLESRDFVNLAEEDQDQNAESVQRVIGDFIGTVHNVQFVKYDVTVSFLAQVLDTDTVTYLVPQVLDTAS